MEKWKFFWHFPNLCTPPSGPLTPSGCCEDCSKSLKVFKGSKQVKSVKTPLTLSCLHLSEDQQHTPALYLWIYSLWRRIWYFLRKEKVKTWKLFWHFPKLCATNTLWLLWGLYPIKNICFQEKCLDWIGLENDLKTPPCSTSCWLLSCVVGQIKVDRILNNDQRHLFVNIDNLCFFLVEEACYNDNIWANM